MRKIKIELSSQSWYENAKRFNSGIVYWGGSYQLEDKDTGKQVKGEVLAQDKTCTSEIAVLIKLLELALCRLSKSPCEIELKIPNNIYFMIGVKKEKYCPLQYDKIHKLLEEGGHVLENIYSADK